MCAYGEIYMTYGTNLNFQTHEPEYRYPIPAGEVAGMKTLSFIALGLPDPSQKAIQDLGFEEPTPIQGLAIPILREGNDVIGQAHTGTGKTAAYGIPIVETADPANKQPQALVLCPTRELAIQVSEELRKLAKYRRGIMILPVYGGQPIERQLHALRAGVQIVIATPGRLLDHLDRKSISLAAVRTVVLDEADEMLDMGFRDDIEAILKKVPAERQTVLFSATMSPQIRDLAGRFMKDPRPVQVMHDQLSVPKIEQSYFEVRESGKIEVLSKLLDLYDPQHPDLCQHQAAGGRDRLPAPGPRLPRRRAPWRHEPVPARAGDGQVPRRKDRHPHRNRCGSPRDRRPCG